MLWEHFDPSTRTTYTTHTTPHHTVDPPTRRLTLSMLLKWYGGDFASASASSSSNSQETAMLRTILPWLPPDVRQQVQGWLEEEGGGGVRVVYAPYDWGLNSK